MILFMNLKWTSKKHSFADQSWQERLSNVDSNQIQIVCQVQNGLKYVNIVDWRNADLLVWKAGFIFDSPTSQMIKLYDPYDITGSHTFGIKPEMASAKPIKDQYVHNLRLQRTIKNIHEATFEESLDIGQTKLVDIFSCFWGWVFLKYMWQICYIWLRPDIIRNLWQSGQ